MNNVETLHFRFIDHGIFLPIAQRLAREAARVSYWSPWEKAFPTVQDCIGDGFADIERVYSPWHEPGTVDCWVFPDIGFAEMQFELLRQGAVVWGARDADSLEISRGRFLQTLEDQTDLLVPPYETVLGMDALRTLLRHKKDCFIKVSKFRGDWETLHWRSWSQDELELESRAVRLGPFKDWIKYYVLEKIETEIEDGCDTYCIDGQFPSLVIHGMEAKDKAFLGTFQKYADLPKELRCVSDQFGPLLAPYDYRGFLSTEVRITRDGQSYFIDPTLRAGSPPSQVMCEMIANLGDIIWQGAQGHLVDPEPVARFGVQGLLCVRGGRKEWRTLELPETLRQWVKCGFSMQVGGRLCFPPDETMTAGEVGWLVGIGNTAEEAIEHLRDNADKLPDGVTCEFASLADLIKEVQAAEGAGMEFTPQPMPEPEIVLESKQG